MPKKKRNIPKKIKNKMSYGNGGIVQHTDSGPLPNKDIVMGANADKRIFELKKRIIPNPTTPEQVEFNKGLLNHLSNLKTAYSVDPRFKAKPGLNQGGQVRQNPYLVTGEQEAVGSDTQYTQEMTNTTKEAVSNIPVIGGFYAIGSAGGEAVRKGNETDETSQVISDIINPSHGAFTAMETGDIEDAVPFMGAFKRAEDASKAERENEKRKLQAQKTNFQNQSRVNLSNFETQGKGNFAMGGQLNPISNGAVEVKANNPGTDTVDIGVAYVDNNEIIDDKQRVFSDDLKAPSGKSFAKEAKKLEKQKMEGYPQANSLLEKKLTKLFQQQEMSKAPALAKGGKMGYNWGGSLLVGAQNAENAQTLEEMEPTRKPYRSTTTQPVTRQITPVPQKLQGLTLDDVELGMKQPTGPDIQPVNNQRTPSSSNNRWSADSISNFAGTYGSNILNSAIINRTPEVPEPITQAPVSFREISTRDIDAANNRRFRFQRRGINQNTSQSSAANALNALTRAQEVQASNQLAGETRRTNAGIKAREAGLNASIEGQNTNRLNQAQLMKVERENKMNSLRSQNYADISNKFMSGRAEQNQMDLDLARLDVIKQQYKDSGIYNRAMEERIKELEAQQARRNQGIA